jgi:multicomponent Na+:H+ antiporter subunit D
VTGYFVKGSVAPFHFWLDDAHAVAPTPICVLFSGIMVQVALYGVARVYWTVFSTPLSAHTHEIKALFVGVGVATALVGAIMAYAQRHLKRLLAFSTVSHSGMFVAALGLFNAAGAAAAAIFIVAHGLIKSSLFICAGTYLNRFRSLDEEVLGGRGKECRLNSALFLIGGVALAGMPPFAISAAKMIYDAALKEHGLCAIAVVMAFATAIDAGAVLRSGIHITWGIGKAQQTGFSPREEETECEEDRWPHTPWPALWAPLLLTALAIFVGTNGTLWNAIGSGAHAFVNRDLYVASVLNNVQRAVWVFSPHRVTLEDIGVNVAVTAAALLAAFAGLFRDHIPQMLNPILGPPLKGLRALHSGIFTDYVAYMVFGIAAYSAWLVLGTK